MPAVIYYPSTILAVVFPFLLICKIFPHSSSAFVFPSLLGCIFSHYLFTFISSPFPCQGLAYLLRSSLNFHPQFVRYRRKYDLLTNFLMIYCRSQPTVMGCVTCAGTVSLSVEKESWGREVGLGRKQAVELNELSMQVYGIVRRAVHRKKWDRMLSFYHLNLWGKLSHRGWGRSKGGGK